MQNLSEKVVETAIKESYISQAQRVEYLYGLKIIINIIINDITMLIIGFAMHMVYECIFFSITYKILRKYCGGFHFSTSLKCYISGCFMCFISLMCIKYVPYNILTWGVTMTVLTVVLFIISPVAAVNKPLDEKEIIIFGRIARFLIVITFTAYIIMTILKLIVAAKVISLALICSAVFAIGGSLQHQKSKK